MTQHKAISAYLFDASALNDPHLVVLKSTSSLTPRKRMLKGSGPTDGGHLILEPNERDLLLGRFPEAVSLVRPLIGAKDSIQGNNRYCLWLKDVSPSQYRHIPPIVERIRAVKAFRLASKKAATRQDAMRPMEFAEIRYTGGPFIVIQRHTSERRDYVPFAFFRDGEVPHDSCQFLADAALSDFALLTSAMHMAWLRHIGGRLESRYRYSIGLVYNTFPLPPKAELSTLDPLAQAVLDARANHPGATLAALYDPDTMPPDLRRAHAALDKAVDRLYHPKGFASDRERVEHLFQRYEAQMKPLLAPKPRAGRAGA